jgi:hypothetical protein
MRILREDPKNLGSRGIGRCEGTRPDNREVGWMKHPMTGKHVAEAHASYWYHGYRKCPECRRATGKLT